MVEILSYEYVVWPHVWRDIIQDTEPGPSQKARLDQVWTLLQDISENNNWKCQKDKYIFEYWTKWQSHNEDYKRRVQKQNIGKYLWF